MQAATTARAPSTKEEGQSAYCMGVLCAPCTIHQVLCSSPLPRKPHLALPAAGVHAHVVTAKHSGPNWSPRASGSLPYAVSVLDVGDAQSIAAFSAQLMANKPRKVIPGGLQAQQYLANG